ncbi:MAG: peptidoglycan DD-metalloendopeptidase family protein [Clostridia bacterium]|nr:peptidoglycan DD-metalloendopeptidase family protein [Clostridiaceae bacterium]
MSRKIISVFIILLMISSLSFSVFAETLNEKKEDVKSKIEEQNQKLEYVQGEISDAVKEIEEIDDKIKDCESQIEDLKTKLAESKKNMDEVTEKYNKVKAEYDKNEKLFQERMVALYEAGDTTYLDVLLSSASITDFISNYYLIERLADYDSQLLTKIESQKKELEESKSKIEEEEKKLQELKSNAIKLTTTLKNSRTLQKSKMDKLTEEEKGIQEEINKYKIEEANIENQIKQATNDGEYQLQYTGGVMLWPVAKEGTVITSPFGTRNHPIQGVVKLHSGIDIGGAGYGAKVVAAEDGVVSFAGTLGGYGNCVIVNHGGGISTLYGHGQTLLTKVGTNVKKGDIIMEVGSTGNSTGPHLHFEVRVNNIAVNPATYLQGS